MGKGGKSHGTTIRHAGSKRKSTDAPDDAGTSEKKQEIPFEYNIAGELHPGKHIEIHGKVKHGEHQQFKVELLSGPNVVFHFDPRFGYGGCHELILNSDIGGWGEEERHHNPFHPGDHFELKIKVHEHKYDIHVNGHEICHFHHRQSPYTVDILRISGDVKVEDFHFHHH